MEVGATPVKPVLAGNDAGARRGLDRTAEIIQNVLLLASPC
jgi:hypothetical protein